MTLPLAGDAGGSVLSGRRWGAYQVHERIGAGGMGEVYRARDPKLARDVAIKVLPSSVATDPDRLARFEREARLLAALNHPHIGGIYGLEEDDGVRGLVLELVGGTTLAERLASGPLALTEALQTAGQIAEALEAAHEKGILHRDLKPANVKVTPDGTVKVLDFGLAKAIDEDASETIASASPTLTAAGTREGVVLGTPAYMSPEQARGKAVDRRTDIWAFGCVLYELLAGRPAFEGETLSDTIAAVLEREPPWHVLPPTTPTPIRRLVQRCLAKNPKQRLRDIGDARIEIAHELAAPTPPTVALPLRRAPRRERGAWALAALGALASLVLGGRALVRQGGADQSGQIVRSVLTLPPGQALELASGSLFAVSPDGNRLVYSASREGRVGLFVRTLDQFETRALEGTDGAAHPFFSPDGRWVGFFANGALKKVPLDGGTPIVICSTPVGHGAGWAPDNTIVYAHPRSGLMRVSADGGTPRPLTTLNTERDETGHDWPQVLPGGQAVLFTIVIGVDVGAGIGIIPLEGGDTRIVARTNRLNADASALLPPGDVVQVRYIASGHLVYGQIGAVWGLPFDLARLDVSGSPLELIDDVFEGPGGGAIYFAVTERGSLLYVPGGAARSLVVSDRRGRTSPLSTMRAPFRFLRLSPDGRRLAVCIDDSPAPTSIWTFDMERGTRARVTSLGHNLLPIWNPDGRRIAYNSLREGVTGLYLQSADGGGEAELLARPGPGRNEPYSWTPDGRTLLFSRHYPETKLDIWSLSVSDRVAAPVLVTPDDDRFPAVSPDGRWLAYVSDESGRYEVYVRPLRGPGARVSISIDGGTEPVWSRNGREIFFRRGNEYYAARVTTGASLDADRPQFLFAGGLPFVSSEVASYDVTPDGQRFVRIESDPESAPTHFRLVTHWTEELADRVPTAAPR